MYTAIAKPESPKPSTPSKEIQSTQQEDKIPKESSPQKPEAKHQTQSKQRTTRYKRNS
jgi:hypothetical protein